MEVNIVADVKVADDDVNVNPSSKVFKEEAQDISVIEAALRQNPQDPDLIFAYCKVLAEKLRQAVVEIQKKVDDEVGVLFDEQTRRVIYFGKKTFCSIPHMRNFLFENFAKLLALNPTCLEYNIGISDICCLTLPKVAKNHQLAKLCLERAILFHHDSPRAISRMGFLILTVEKDVPAARNYFKLAKEKDPNNFKSTTAFLYSIFANLEEFKSKIGNLLKEAALNKTFSWDQLSVINFICGLFSFFVKDTEKLLAISWIKAFNYSENQLKMCFERLQKIKSMYQFPADYVEILSLPRICLKLKDSIQMYSQQKSFCVVLKKIREMIKTVGRMNPTQPRSAAITNGALEVLRRKPEKVIFTLYPAIEKLTIGSRDGDLADAFQTLGIPDQSPKPVVDDVYRKICYTFMEKGGDNVHPKKIDMFAINSAFATLHRHFERQARKPPAVLCGDDLLDDKE